MKVSKLERVCYRERPEQPERINNNLQNALLLQQCSISEVNVVVERQGWSSFCKYSQESEQTKVQYY